MIREEARVGAAHAIQLDLFEERTVQLQRSRRLLLESLDLERARGETRRFVASYGPDAEIERLDYTIAAVENALCAEMQHTGNQVEALLRIGPSIPGWLRPGWHRRIALEAERRAGAGCRVGAETVGFHLLRAGDLEQAERSLRATLERDPDDARSRARLGDALFRRCETAAARAEYLRALLEGPEAVDWADVADAQILALPAIAATEYQVLGQPADWAAAVGTIEGVLPMPAAVLDGLGVTAALETASLGLRFYGLLREEWAARTLAERARIRRSMKALCPSLLRAYLERWR